MSGSVTAAAISAVEVHLDPAGLPASIVDGAGNGLHIAAAGWSFDLDGRAHAHRPTLRGPSLPSLVEPGRWTTSGVAIDWTVDQPQHGIVRATWSITNTGSVPVMLGSCTPIELLLGERFEESFDYRMSGDVPFAIVGRGPTSSTLIVSENPLVRFDVGDLWLRVEARANIRIAPGECFVGEPIYVVHVPTRSGHVVGRCLPKESGHLADRGGLVNPRNRVLDQAEIDGFRRLLDWRIPRRRQHQVFYDLDWVNALHPDHLGSPNQQEGDGIETVVEQHRGIFDQMQQVGVDHVVIDQALVNSADAAVPDESGWQVDPRADAIVEEAKRRGFEIGLYNGCGNWPNSWTGMYSSSAPFLQDGDPNWKVLGGDGLSVTFASPHHAELAPDVPPRQINCLAHAPFRRWFIDIVSTTIATHGLSWWGWDVDDVWQFPIGSCLAEHHDHAPGDTAYALWRAMREVEGELRRRHPALLIMNYWGRKSLGVFGLTNCDQNENSCEYLPIWPEGGQIAQMMGELSGWRFGWWDETLAWPSANDLRLQYWFNAVDRFLPNHLGYGPYNAELVELVAAVGAGAMIAVYDVIPDDQLEVATSWFRFAEVEQDLLSRGRPAWGPPRRGGVDGWWHNDGHRALAFLFNPNADELGVEIPAPCDGLFAVRDRSPEPGPWLQRGGSTAFDGAVGLAVAGRSWRVVELLPAGAVDGGASAPEDEPSSLQPFGWDAATLVSYEATLPPFPVDLASSSITKTGLYPAEPSSGARAL